MRTEGLVKDYGRVRGLDGLDLEVRSGEVYGFLGPNGAGKTTTIRILFDLIRPTMGSVSVLGLDPRTDGIELRRRVGYLADDFVVDGRQTARELLAYLANCGEAFPLPGSTIWPSVSTWNSHERSGLCPGAIARRSEWSRPSCTTRTCSSSTSRPAVSIPSCSRSSRSWFARRYPRGERCSCPHM